MRDLIEILRRYWKIGSLGWCQPAFRSQRKKQTGRGGRLKGHTDLFTGLVWSGEKALEQGLVVDYGSTYMVAQEVIGESEVKDFTPLVPLIERLVRGWCNPGFCL